MLNYKSLNSGCIFCSVRLKQSRLQLGIWCKRVVNRQGLRCSKFRWRRNIFWLISLQSWCSKLDTLISASLCSFWFFAWVKKLKWSHGTGDLSALTENRFEFFTSVDRWFLNLRLKVINNELPRRKIFALIKLILKLLLCFSDLWL
jgi:hypothetical protein